MNMIDKTNIESPHLLINGDNIKILEELRKHFFRRVKCIYIDPPYNNGEDYSFYNDVYEHDKWITRMRETLLTLKDFLSPDGSLWISIDDGEMHYLKVLCDEIFGRNSFIATIVWQQRNTRENRRAFSYNHEYVLVYASNPAVFKKTRNLLPITNDVLSRYNNPDDDARGPWQSVSANVQDGHAVASQFYEIIAPNGKKHLPPQGRCWVYNQERMEREILEGNIWFGKDGNGVPRIKKFISNSKQGVVPETLWTSDFAGTNKDAKTHLQQLKIYDKKLFDTPKPELLIYRILSISTNENDIVLDAFLGSGTTTSVAHKMNRNYIGIEIGVDAFRYSVGRMKKVTEGEQGGISKRIGWHGAGEFTIVSP